MAQETQTWALYQPRGVGWGERWEGVSKGRGYLYIYGWFMLRFDRKQQNSRNQLSFSSFQFRRSVVSDFLRPHGLQHTRPPCPSPTPGVYSNSCPLSRWCHWTVASSVIPFSSAFNLSQHQGLFRWLSSLHQVAKVLEFQLQHQSFQWIFMTDFL